MISRNQLKRLTAQVLLLLGALGLLAALTLTAKVTVWSSSGANVGSAFHEVPELPAEADRLASWLDDAWTQERRMEPATRIAIEAAYVRAWAAIARFEGTGATDPVLGTFSGPAREQVLATRPHTAGPLWSVRHQLQLTFYALDGGTVAFHDIDAQLVRATHIGQGRTFVTTTDDYAVVMVLEDGYWRVRQLRRTKTSDAQVVGTTGGATLLSGVTKPPPAAVPATPAINGITYQPTGWPNYDPTGTASDLARIRQLGLDTIRVELPFSALGAAKVDERRLEHLKTFLHLAATQQLHVIYVLFGGVTDLDPGNWAEADQHLRTIVTALRGQDQPLIWDLMDKPDLRGAERIETAAWLVHELVLLRRLTPEQPVTVSYSNPEAIDPTISQYLDLVAFHLPTTTSSRIPGELAKAISLSAGRPLLISGFGMTSYNGLWPGGHTEAEQARYLADVRVLARRVGITRLVHQRLRDHDAPAHIGLAPWSAQTQARTGILRRDGSAKAAVAALRPEFDPSRIPRPGWSEAARKPMWWAGAVALACLWGAYRYRRRAKNRKPDDTATAPKRISQAASKTAPSADQLV